MMMFLNDFSIVLQLLSSPIILLGYLLVLLILLVIKVINRFPPVVENPTNKKNKIQNKIVITEEEMEIDDSL